MIIYTSGGVPIIDIEVDDASYRYRALMRSDELTLVFSLTQHVELPLGANCTFEGTTYYLLSLSNVTIHHRRDYEYKVRMSAPMELTKNFVIYNVVDKRLRFEQSGTPREHLQQIIDNLNAREGSGWAIGTCIDADPKILSYNYTTCWDGIVQIAEAFNTEFEIADRTVSIKKVEYHKDGPLALSYGAGNGLRTGVKRVDSSMGVGRVYIQGGDRNIGLDNYDAKTLHLPKGETFRFGGTDFVESGGVSMTVSADGLSLALTDAPSNVTEDSLDLSNIYPSREGEVTSVVYEYKKNFYSYTELVTAFPNLTEDDWYDICVHFCDSTIPAELDYDECLMGNDEPLTVIFQGQSGMLLGREFNVTFDKEAKTKTVDGQTVTLIPANRFEMEHATIDGVDMPNATFRPSVGDKYAVFNCALPQAYINAGAVSKEGAEWEAAKEAAKYLYENMEPKVSYKGDLDPLFAKGNWEGVKEYLTCGSYISFSDPAVQSTPIMVRIIGVRQNVNNRHAPVFEFSNDLISPTLYSTIKQLQAGEAHVESLSKQGRQYTQRSFRSAKETMQMLIDAAIDGYTEQISPIAVQTMQMIAGDERLQFKFYEESTCATETDPVHYDPAAKIVSFDAAYLKHMTLGIDSITSSHELSEYSVWQMDQMSSEVLSDPDKRYYLYAVVSKDDLTVHGSYLLSEQSLPLDDDSGSGPAYYNLLIGVLNSEVDGVRNYAPLYGFTEVLPGQITTDKIRSANGYSWLDLAANQMRFGNADGTKALSWNINNGGELSITGGTVQLGYMDNGTYMVMSGLNGEATAGTSIAAWFGGPMADRYAASQPETYAQSLFRMDGTGYLAGGNIRWNADGSGSVAGGNISWTAQGVPTIAGDITISNGMDSTTLAAMIAALYFQSNSTLSSLVELKSLFSYIGARNGIFFSGATLTGTPTPDLYVDTVNGQRVLRTPLPLITGGDQIVISGTPGGGGGGGGAANMYELSDVYGGSSSVLRYNATAAASTDLLAYDADNGRGWYAVRLGSNLSLSNGVLSATGGGGSGAVDSIKVGDTSYVPDSSGVVSLPAYPTVTDENVKQTNTTGNSDYRVLLSYSANNTTLTEGARKSGGLTFNPSTGALTVSGAVNGLSLYANTTGFTISGGTNTSKSLTISQSLSLTGASGASYDLDAISIAATNGATAYGYFSSGVLPYNHGGTGQSSYTKGDMLYASANNTLAKLGANTSATKKFLSMTSSIPTWEEISVTAASVFGSSAIGSASLPVYYTGSALATITELDLLSKSTGYVKANRFYLTSSIYFYTETVSGTTCVKLNAPLITTGDQIVISGTPGGGSGGASTLQGLDDTQIPSNPSLITNGYVLTWDSTDQKWEPKAASGGVTSVVGQTGAVTAAQIATALTDAGYKLTDTVYSLPVAANGTLGGIQIGYSESGTNYAVKLSSEKAYVSVPWTDANVKQTNSTTSSSYRVLLSGHANDTEYTEGTYKSANLTFNPSTGALSLTGTINGLTLTKQTSGFTITGGTLSKTLTVGADYTLGAACEKSVTDSSSASAIGTGTSLPTERDIYYGLPTINNSHNYTSSTTIYAPTGAGTAGYWLKASGSSTAPVWESTANLTAGKATADGDGNTISSTYLKLAGGTMTGAIKLASGSGKGLQNNASTGKDILYYSSSDLYLGFAGTSSATLTLLSYNNLTHRKYTSSSAYTDNTIWDEANSNLTTVAWACSELSVGTNWKLGINSGAFNWYYSNTSVASLSSSGLLATSGDQVISSDEALKTNLRNITYTVDDIALCRAVTFDWKDGRGRSAGSIAQDWKKLIPELVHGERGNMSLAYGQLALVNTILIARHETEQDYEIRRLRERVDYLEKEVQRLKH